MKKFIALVITSFALTAFAAEPAKTEEKPKPAMKLAKKKKDKDAEKAAAKKSAPAKKQ